MLDRSLALEVEAAASEMARRAGELVHARFGRALEVEYKGEGKSDPVTSADVESQALLTEAIVSRFPDHGIVGEEDKEEARGSCPEFLWVLDPLDGTTNFLNGLPVYAVSIGVLHRGWPVAGALFVPWPGKEPGVVLQAHRGGGAKLDGEPLILPPEDRPHQSRITGLPGSFGGQFRPTRELVERLGQVRMTGSAVYELAMAACGVLQYVVLGAPRLWDMAGGALIVQEAGGTVVRRSRRTRQWEALDTCGPSWDGGPPSLSQVRGWVRPLIAGGPRAVEYAAANLRARRSLRSRARRAFRRLARRWRR